MIDRVLFVPFLVLALAACGPRPDPKAAEAAKAATAAAEATQMERDFETHFAAGRWDLARAQGDVLIARHPKSEAARRITGRHAEARAKAETAREDARLAGLWDYQRVPGGKGEQVTAAIYAREPIDAGLAKSQVRLIFRDHPEWGRSSYLVIDSGDFDCYGGCSLKMRVDGKARSMAGSRPRTDEAIAMFVEDERALWRTVRGAKELVITLPIKGRGTREAVFEVGGLDAGRMPRW